MSVIHMGSLGGNLNLDFKEPSYKFLQLLKMTINQKEFLISSY